VINEKVVEENAMDLAKMLYYGSFEASVLFTFFTSPNNPFYDSIFDEFIRLMDFSYLDFDIAFRYPIHHPTSSSSSRTLSPLSPSLSPSLLPLEWLLTDGGPV
jgi:hypothetical protein